MISVLIGTYQQAEFIERAVESVLSQNAFSDTFEILIIDDGSTDDTHLRLSGFGTKLRYYYQQNQGQASVLNRGIREAKGEVIAFLDADDAWHPDKLRIVTEEFRKGDSVDAVFHYLNYVDSNKVLIGTHPHSRLEHKICRDSYDLQNYLMGRLSFFPPTSGICIRKTCLLKIGDIPKEFRICADAYLQLMIPFYARQFKLVRQYLGDLTLHANNSWTEREFNGHTVKEQVELQKGLLTHLGRIEKKGGWDVRPLRQRMKSDLVRRQIALDHLRGRHLEAIAKSLIFIDRPVREKWTYRIFKKMTLILSVIVPFRAYDKLRKKYRESVYFDFIHEYLN